MTRRSAPSRRGAGGDAPRLYGELAPYFHLLTDPADYAEEASFYRRLVREHCRGRARTVLELGSGGGNNASHLKKHFEMTLVDLSPGMLRLSRSINPECEHRRGDMRTVRVGREFDAVFVHDAIMYMTSEDDLRAAIETAAVHCRSGGVVLLVPDVTAETFEEGTRHGGHDAASGRRGIRYLEWTWDPDPDDTEFNVEFAYLVRDGRGRVRAVRDRHTFGLFPRGTWLRLMRESGLRPRAVAVEISDAPVGMRAFVGRRG